MALTLLKLGLGVVHFVLSVSKRCVKAVVELTAIGELSNVMSIPMWGLKE